MQGLPTNKLQRGGTNSGDGYVNDRLELINGWNTKDLRGHLPQIKAQIKAILLRRRPVLAGMTEVKIVSNERKNLINLRVLPMYQTLLHFECIDQDYYCFFLSDKFEPFMIITIVDGTTGERRVAITEKHVRTLLVVIRRFKDKYGITGESYHYTGLEERLDTAGNGVANSMKSHSKNFHLKMRISKGMLQHHMPINRLLEVDRLCVELEPVQYAFTRQTFPLEALQKILLAEVGAAAGPNTTAANTTTSSNIINSGGCSSSGGGVAVKGVVKFASRKRPASAMSEDSKTDTKS